MPNHVANVITFTGTRADIALVTSLVINPATDESIEGADKGEPFVDFNILIPMPASLKVERVHSFFSDLQLALARLEMIELPVLTQQGGTQLDSLPIPVETERARALIVKALSTGQWDRFYVALCREAARLMAADWVPQRLMEAGRPVGIAGLVDYVVTDLHLDFERQHVFLKNKAEHGFADWYDFSVARWGTKWGAYSSRIETSTDGDNETLKISFDTAWSPPEPWFDALIARLDGSVSEGFSIQGFCHDEGWGFWGSYSLDGCDATEECDKSESHDRAYQACYGCTIAEATEGWDDDSDSAEAATPVLDAPADRPTSIEA